jgi:hypothetical protein
MYAAIRPAGGSRVLPGRPPPIPVGSRIPCCVRTIDLVIDLPQLVLILAHKQGADFILSVVFLRFRDFHWKSENGLQILDSSTGFNSQMLFMYLISSNSVFNDDLSFHSILSASVLDSSMVNKEYQSAHS